MELMTKFVTLGKRVQKILETDADLAKRVHDYTDNFYLFYEDENYLSSGEKVPYYFYWDGGLRTAFFGLLAICSAVAVMLVRIVCMWANPGMFIFMCVIFALFAYVLYWAYIPNSLYPIWKKSYRDVCVIRFRTKGALERFEQYCKIAEDLAEPYKEEQRRQEAKQEAAQAKRTEQLKDKFRPQYMRLLEHVEISYKISTPDPDCYAGYFTIILPDTDDTGLTEHRCAYADGDAGVEQLIDKLADLGIMRERDKLRDIAHGFTDVCTNCQFRYRNVPSDDAHSGKE